MSVLIIVSHSVPTSLTHAIARRVAEGVRAAGNSVDLADLAAEGFDPRFQPLDIEISRSQRAPAEDVLSYQRRIDACDALVLVFPIYWWSMPGLLKGWIDRVFTNGWAYEYKADAGLVKKLGRLEVHILGIGGADHPTYVRHGYLDAMRTQIDHGIFDYCGAAVVTSELMLEADSLDPGPHLGRAYDIGRSIGRLAHASGDPRSGV